MRPKLIQIKRVNYLVITIPAKVYIYDIERVGVSVVTIVQETGQMWNCIANTIAVLLEIISK